MKLHLRFITMAITILILVNISVHAQSVNSGTSKILILHSMKEKRPWNLMYNACIREALKDNKKLEVELFTENLDLLEYNDEKYKDVIAKMLHVKYNNDLPDILIITQPEAVKFVFERNLFPTIPKILILPSKQDFEHYPNATIITYAADFEVQFKHALKLFPKTKEVYVIAGNSKIDKATLDKFVNANRNSTKQVLFTYLTNLDRDSILNRVNNIPQHSFVYYLSYTQDLSGKAFMAKDFSCDLAENCNRPVFCYLDLLTENTGILGGMVVSLKSTAAITVEFVAKYFEGTTIENMNSTASNMSYTYDWGELKKWNIDREQLPKESIFYNRTYTFIELYKNKVIISFVLLLIYTLLFILLLYINRKRKKSEKDLFLKNKEYEAINEELTQSNEDLWNANVRTEESINRLQIFINTIPDLVWLKDIDGIYLECNNRFEGFFGNKRKDIIGKTDYDFVSKELADFFRLHDKAAMDAGKPLINEEQIIFASDGHKEFLETIKTPLYSLNGEVVGVLGIGRDISQRILSKQELLSAKEKAEKSEKSYKDVVETTNDLITVVDNQGIFIFVNHASTYFYGIPPAACIGKLAFDYIHPNDKEFTKIEFAKWLNSDECNFYLENRQVSIEGKILQVAWNIHIERHRDKIIKITSIARDITKQKQIENELIKAKEKAEESDRLKTAFLQNMSHEIRTPLNAISGFSGMLNKPELSEEKKNSFVSIIQNSTRQLVSIVSDILTISSIETQQQKINQNKVCINNIIVDLLAIFKQQSQNQNIALYAKQQLNNKQSEIYTDPTKITQILTNLISNALKFTHQGFIEFGYNLKGKELEFYVKDTGIGIKPEFHEKIFERFRQANENINTQYGGTGLGLAISKAFAELLGGKIWVESELKNQPVAQLTEGQDLPAHKQGKTGGSTFYFTIPYKPVNEIDKATTPTKQNENFRTLLVAEDEEYNFLYIEELLMDLTGPDFSWDVKLIHAKDGKETVEIFKTNPNIDLILMDIKMPVMTGHEAAKIIKELNPNLPIIAQSAYALEHERAKYEGIFDDYLIKPISEDALKQTVKRYFNEKMTSSVKQIIRITND